MESANIPHHLDLHQEQQQQVGYGASSNSSNQFPWSPTSSPHINNVGNRIYQNPNPNPNTELYNTRKYTGEKDENGEVQNPWSSNSARNPTEDHHQHQTLIPTHHQTSNRSKLDLFNSLLFPKFSDMICSNQSSIEDLQLLSPTGYLKNDSFQDLNLQHDTKVSPSGFFQPQFQAAQFLSNPQIYSDYERSSSSLPLIPSRGNFSQIFPSIDISSLNNTESNSASSGPFDMNLQALDLLTSARFNGHIRHDRQSHHLRLPRESPAFEHRPTTSPNKLQPSFHGGSTTEAKRPQSETKPSQSSSKKSRSDSPACPPFKVRKEKLGDRIAALQQLVAPFGKTDTASVLMEAIGYIKFLQSQVETLSVPYMKSTRTRHIKPTQMGRLAAIDGNVESRPDLRSRGLCLVPLSCMSYVTDDGAGGWPSSEYHGGT